MSVSIKPGEIEFTLIFLDDSSLARDFVNTKRPVLFESIKNNRVIGHTDNYLKVEVDGNKNIINTIKTVKLTKMKDQTLIGELV